MRSNGNLKQKRRRKKLKEYKINEDISLKLEKGKTKIYIFGKELIQCVGLRRAINISQLEEIKDVDELINVGFPATATKIKPEEEFWGHCSNMEVWVENDFNPRTIHTRLATTILKKLWKKKPKYFEKYVLTLEETWREYKREKDKKRMELFKKKHKNAVIHGVVRLGINKRDFDYDNSFMNEILFSDDYEELSKIEKEKIEKEERKKLNRKINYYERKIFKLSGKDTWNYRNLLRDIRSHIDTVEVSNPEDYPSFIWSKYNHLFIKIPNDNHLLVKRNAPEEATHLLIVNSWGYSQYGGSGSWNTEDYHRGFGKVVYRMKDGSFKIDFTRLSWFCYDQTNKIGEIAWIPPFHYVNKDFPKEKYNFVDPREDLLALIRHMKMLLKDALSPNPLPTPIRGGMNRLTFKFNKIWNKLDNKTKKKYDDLHQMVYDLNEKYKHEQIPSRWFDKIETDTLM